MSGIEYRLLQTAEEYAAALALQRKVWGASFAEAAPPSILMVVQKVGGIAAGAFVKNRLIGLVFGITGWEKGHAVHWSDLLAVDPEWQGRGIGRQLKWFQRALLLQRQVSVVRWSYEPLEARNAYLNLCRLGARVKAYIPDMYLESSGSELHAGLGMDRLIVSWDLLAPEVHYASDGQVLKCAPDWRQVPVVGWPDRKHTWPDLERLRIPIPRNLQALKAKNAQQATVWRQVTREAFTHYLSKGYEVVGFDVDNKHGYYLLKKR